MSYTGLVETCGAPARMTVRLLSTFVTLFTLAFFHLLHRWPDYHPGTHRLVNEADARPRVLDAPRKAYVIRFFVACYRQSLIWAYLHRNGRRCRYMPTCADYAVRAVEKYGYRSGLKLASGRFRRCSPDCRHDYIDFP